MKKQLSLLVQKDDKIQILANSLNQNEDKKVLVFTYFADTLKYLQDNLPKYLIHHKNVEFAIGNKNEIENFAKRFAPFSKRHELKTGEKEIDYLICTDKLSEGQNLQDCGIIINYDLHWNPVRMIQRNGRINRLGSKHENIYIYNFRPTEQLESYLNLVRKLEDKINLIRYTIGSDQSILDEEPIPQDFTEDLYSHDEKKRLAAFQKIYETSELLAAEDLFMDDLREFDRNESFTKNYKRTIKELPKGKWGKISLKKEDEDVKYLAHVLDENDEAGYFIQFDQQHIPEMVTTAEGLLQIKVTSEENARFHDPFKNKPIVEQLVNNTIQRIQLADEEPTAGLTQKFEGIVQSVAQKMQEYGYPADDIELVYHCMMTSQNAYLNKLFHNKLRLINRLKRREQHVDSSIYNDLLSLAKAWNPEEKSERPPIVELIQIFA